MVDLLEVLRNPMGTKCNLREAYLYVAIATPLTKALVKDYTITLGVPSPLAGAGGGPR